MSATTSQRDKVLARLQRGPVTTAELVEMRIVRYGARFHELRERGHVIRWRPVRKGSRTNLYWLEA